MNVDAAYSMMKAFKVVDVTESLEDKVHALEQQLDLKDYYDIKRPNVVFFT